MIRQLSTWLVVGLAGAGLIAGCGESGSSTSTVTVAPTGPAVTATTSTSVAGVAGDAAGTHGSASVSGGQPTSTPAAPAPAIAATTSPSVWNAVQCSGALLSWFRGHKPVTANQLRAYKRTLRSQHGCYTPDSRNPTPPTAGANVWNAVQCSTELIRLEKSNSPITVSQLHAFKRTLREQHGCYTAASLYPGGPAQPKHHQ